MSTRSLIYRALRLWGDADAARKGRLPERLVRRAYYRQVFKLARKVERGRHRK